MTLVCVEFIRKLLSAEQKNIRFDLTQDNLEMINYNENVLKKIITGDESWVYDRATKQPSSQWKRQCEPCPKKSRQSRSNVKAMMIAFFDCKDDVLHK